MDLDLSLFTWVKAEASNPSGDCVEIGFVKSSHSGNNGGCVELSATEDQDVFLMRDSKDPDGPKLRFNRREMDAFLRGARDGEFDFLLG